MQFIEHNVICIVIIDFRFISYTMIKVYVKVKSNLSGNSVLTIPKIDLRGYATNTMLLASVPLKAAKLR